MVAGINKNISSLFRFDYGVQRNNDLVLVGAAQKFEVGNHLRRQLAVGVRDGDLDLEGAALGIDTAIDKRNLAFQVHLRKSIECYLHRSAEVNIIQKSFRHAGSDFHVLIIDEIENGGHGHGIRPGIVKTVVYVTVQRRPDEQLGISRLGQLVGSPGAFQSVFGRQVLVLRDRPLVEDNLFAVVVQLRLLPRGFRLAVSSFQDFVFQNSQRIARSGKPPLIADDLMQHTAFFHHDLDPVAGFHRSGDLQVFGKWPRA